MKKNKKTIPTIIGLVTLIIGMATGILLVKNKQLFKLGAEPELNPKDIRVSNINDSSFAVSWTTSKEVQGFVIWGSSQGSLNKTALSATGSENYTHSVALEKLSPETPYFFKINSGGYEFDNEGIPWQIKTGPKLPSPPLSNLIAGSILTSSGSPAAKVMVYATVAGSSLLSTLTSEEGDWIIPISNARGQNLTSYVPIDETSTLVEISVQGGPLGVASAQIYPKSATPAPPIILGRTHNFKTVSPSVDNEVPAATVDLPEESTPSSGFSVPDEIPTELEKTVTLENINEGETVTDATTLKFSGEGPPGATLTITLESDPITDQIKVGTDGNWSWDPPSGLAEGIHVVTISWRDAGEILRTLTRSFTVNAQTLTATPTLTPTPSLSPTPTPSPTPTRVPTKTSTPSALPSAGTTTPTIMLAIMGLSFLVFGGLLYSFSKQD